MKLIQRIGYYLGGFSIGLIILAFFLSGKKTSCAYGPKARVLKNIYSKPFEYSSIALSKLDTVSINKLLHDGDINFSKSSPRETPCGTYIIEGELEDVFFEVFLKNCDSIVKITDVVRE